jgi:hypothetical protein
MSQELSMASRRDITKKYAVGYAKAGRADKGRMLDELVAVTGWSRDHARRAIRRAAARRGAAGQRKREPRARKYSYDALVVLQEVWRLSGQPCGKYLAAVMDDTLERLARFRELGKVKPRATPQVLDELRAMSGATIDRYLAPHKASMYPLASLSGTRPSLVLRASIPTRTCLDPGPAAPGLLELDTVAHCGHTMKGDFLWTLTGTDPLTGWTMLRTIKNKAHVHIDAGLDWLAANSPCPIACLDFDNGGEFPNWGVVAWADRRGVQLTRGRPYHHNDNAHVEQRNGDWVRRHAFRYRYETDTEMALLNELWDLVMARKNYLLPCVKATGTTTTRSGRRKTIYDTPATPHARLAATKALDEKTTTRMETARHKLNPARITRRIAAIQHQLIELAAHRTTNTRPAT